MSRAGRFCLNVAAQPHDEVVDRACIRIFVEIPHLFQDLSARNRPPAVTNEVAKKLCFHERELKRLLARAQLEFLKIHGLVAEGECFRSGAGMILNGRLGA